MGEFLYCVAVALASVVGAVLGDLFANLLERLRGDVSMIKTRGRWLRFYLYEVHGPARLRAVLTRYGDRVLGAGVQFGHHACCVNWVRS